MTQENSSPAFAPPGSVAFVSGGTGAIGGAICAKLQSLGMRIVAADRDVRPVPEGQLFVACDVTDPASLDAALAFAAGQGPLAVMVAAHGILRETPAGSADLAAVSDVIDVNLKGVAFLCDLSRRHLAAQASIVLTSSWTAVAAGRIKNAYAYQATKAGVEQLTCTFAVAYGPHVRVNAVAPGFMADPMKGPGAELRARQGGMDAVAKAAPLQKLVVAEDVAEAVAFLCSPAASSITGIVLPVDAGYRAL